MVHDNSMKRISRRRLLKTSAAVAAGWALPAALLSPVRKAWGAHKPFDLLITGGTVVDGTLSAARATDVGIRDGRIITIGILSGAPAARTLDARGLIVAPGFIDVHTHSDRTLLSDGTAQSAIRQGVTTHVTGNCGYSPAPSGAAPAVTDKEIEKEKKAGFRTFAEYLKATRDSGTSVHVCALVGHNSVRETVMGMQNRQPTESELRKMQDLVEEAMQAGAIGMSTGLVSPPGAWSKTEEIVALAKVVARHGGVYASHMRGEARTLLDSVREALRIGQEAKLPVQISHHKAAGRENWGKTRQTLPMIEESHRQGVMARVDVYPYRAGSAGLSQFVPPWAHEGGTGAMIERLKDPQTRSRILRDMVQGSEDWPNFFVVDWDDIQITSVVSAENRKWVGKRVGDAARERGCSGVEACADLLIEERGSIGMINFIMNEEEMQGVLKHPLAMIGSDGLALSAAEPAGQPHPRSYGCYPRVLGRYCRELKLFSLETAIHKMTGMPAAQFGLSDRGELREGRAADVVLFDFKTIIDRATFDAPHQYPLGIDSVIVEGKLVLHQEKHTGARPGKILAPQRT
jgi:N-acyl-D-amino-acid deacylase